MALNIIQMSVASACVRTPASQPASQPTSLVCGARACKHTLKLIRFFYMMLNVSENLSFCHLLNSLQIAFHFRLIHLYLLISFLTHLPLYFFFISFGPFTLLTRSGDLNDGVDSSTNFRNDYYWSGF